MTKKLFISLTILPVAFSPALLSVSCSNEDEIRAMVESVKNKIISTDCLGPENTIFETNLSFSRWERLDFGRVSFTKEKLQSHLGITKEFDNLSNNTVYVEFNVDNGLTGTAIQKDLNVIVTGNTNDYKNKYVTETLTYKINKPTEAVALIAANKEIDDYIASVFDVLNILVDGANNTFQSPITFSQFPDSFLTDPFIPNDIEEFESAISQIIGSPLSNIVHTIGSPLYWYASWEKDTTNQRGTLRFNLKSDPAPYREVVITVLPKVS